MSYPPSITAAQPWTSRLLNSAWLDGHALNFFLEQINPLWSLLETRARVIEVIDENHDTRSLVLAPGWGWKPFVPGQHIGVCVEIEGVQHRRRYSISSAQTAHSRAPITITVKRESGGKVSNYLHDRIRRGDVLALAPPAGDFVLPPQAPDRLLLLAAGSGITPIMAQLRAWLQQDHRAPVILLHYVRSVADRIFAAELEILQQQHPQLEVHWCFEDDPTGRGRFTPQQLQQLVPDYRDRHVMLCGPAGFMAAVRQHWQSQHLSDQLQFESFGGVPTLAHASAAGTGQTAEITLSQRRRQLKASTGESLLEALEAAGESPDYGCRQGICQSCRCRKTQGSVRNLLTGTVSREPEVDIQLCISAAESDLILAY